MLIIIIIIIFTIAIHNTLKIDLHRIFNLFNLNYV